MLHCMCGRYASFLPVDVLARFFEVSGPLPNIDATWNMAPTKLAPVVRLDPVTGARQMAAFQWGLLPPFVKDLSKARKPINARAETVTTTPMFRSAFAHRRCLVPAAAYYEWRHDPGGKTPFAIARRDGEPVVFAGMWEEWRSPAGEVLRTFATMTVDANPPLALIQERMPVLLERADWPVWLGEEPGDAMALLRPLPSDQLRVWAVSRKVNSVRNDGPELLREVQSAEGQEAALL